ncbi:hypothetical protein DFH09DRAFT_1460808 [Mycena vulgaris]|nr:hypothetical protein DFH09DRAFT_1460808 [Mycena vulgaris]
MGPPSTTRPVTRKQSAQAIVAPAETPITENDVTPVTVSTFDHFGFMGPPGGKETVTNMSLRNAHNFAMLADIVGGIDGRLELLQRVVINRETEEDLRSAGDTATAPNSPRASDAGSVDSIDPAEALGERVDALDIRADALEANLVDHAAQLEGLDSRVDGRTGSVSRGSAQPYSLIEMSNAVGAQFKTIRADRDVLNKTLDAQAMAQKKVNKEHAKITSELLETIRRLEETMTRIELSPATHAFIPRDRSPSPASRVHPRSLSPEQSISNYKRARSIPVIEASPYVVMGPVIINSAMTPLETLQFYMHSALPTYTLPESTNFDVILDPFKAGHLRIRMVFAAEARALAVAWAKGGNPTVHLCFRPLHAHGRTSPGRGLHYIFFHPPSTTNHHLWKDSNKRSRKSLYSKKVTPLYPSHTYSKISSQISTGTVSSRVGLKREGQFKAIRKRDEGMEGMGKQNTKEHERSQYQIHTEWSNRRRRCKDLRRGRRM